MKISPAGKSSLHIYSSICFFTQFFASIYSFVEAIVEAIIEASVEFM